jgi:tetratricopeptide (TPR) repeat protein
MIYGAIGNYVLEELLAHPPQDDDEFINRLRRALARHVHREGASTANARFRLMQLYKVKKQYEAAIEEGRTVLRIKGLSHSFESKVHVEVAVCFDFIGQTAEADAHRSLADECLDNSPEDALGWRVQGEVFDKQKRFAEAAEAYEKALGSDPTENKQVHDELLLRLTLSTFNAGRPDQALDWAERAIAAGVKPSLLYTAHRMAGVAASSLGRLDDSLAHRQKSYEMAVAGGDPKMISECMASLAEVRRMRGDLDQAESLSEEARGSVPIQRERPS